MHSAMSVWPFFHLTMNKILSAGRELLKGDFPAALKSLYPPVEVVPSTFRGVDGATWFIEQMGSSTFHFKYSGNHSSLTAYENCPPINAIINRKAQAYINGKTWVLNTQGKVSTTEPAKKIRALLAKPNPIQSWEQFEAQGYIYEQLFGWYLLLPIKPVGFKDNIDATSLWNIPPSMIDIDETNKLFYQTDINGIIKKIVLNYKGTRTEIKVDDVYIMKDFMPSFNSLVFPQSRIRALELPINNIIGCYESRNVLINYRGALGILSQDAGTGQFQAIAMTGPEKEQLQADFRRYGLSHQQWQFIITNASLKWQQMGVATKDLMLFEEIEDDIARICDSYNYPYQLTSSAKGTTFSNVKEAKQLLYQDATIPEAGILYGQWNNFFDTQKYNITLDKDYSHIPVLQEDALQAAQARKARNDALLIEYQNDLITMNRWLELNGEDPRPEGNRYYSEIKKEQDETSGQEETQSAEGDSGAQNQG